VEGSSVDALAVGGPAVVSLREHLLNRPRGDMPYREALFTTFTSDLAFVEREVLKPVRDTGAAVTVLADAQMHAPDPYAIHSAGRLYLLGLVDIPRAFHPKVSVLVGDDSALITVGSGNLTVGGWIANEEAAIVVKASRAEGVPLIVADVVEWLGTLAQMPLATSASQAVERTWDLLAGLVVGATPVDTGHRLVSSHYGPILEQLPDGPVDELRLAAPFHDPGGAAFDALLARCTPKHVRIAVQPGRTIIDPERLQAVADTRDVRVTWHRDGEERARHGKVIEAVVSDAGWTLTGSPNLTSAALTRGLAGGGNSEVGVVTRSWTPLVPIDDPGSADLPPALAMRSERRTARSAVPTLIAATLVGREIVVELARAADTAIDVEVSHYDLATPPDRYTYLGTVAPGEVTARFMTEAALPATSRVRLVLRGAEADRTTWGAFVPLTDLVQATARLSPRPRRGVHVPDVGWGDLLSSDVERILKSIDAVLRERASVPRAGSRAEPTRESDVVSAHSTRATYDDLSVWASYTEEVVDLYGPTLAASMFGGDALPGFPRLVGADSAGGRPSWADDFASGIADPEDEQTAEELDETTEEAQESTADNVEHEPMSVARKRRVREWCVELVGRLDRHPSLPVAACRLILWWGRQDVWADPTAWFDVLEPAARAVADDEVLAKHGGTAASLAALCLSQLDRLQHLGPLDPDPRVGTGRRYSELRRELRVALTFASAEVIERVALETYGAVRGPGIARESLDFLDAVLAEDEWQEIADAVWARRPEWDISVESPGVFTVWARRGQHFSLGAEVLMLTDKRRTVAVKVTVGDSRSRIIACHDRRLVVEDFVRRGERVARVWRTYRLGGRATAMLLATNEELRAFHRIDLRPTSRPSATAREILASVGLPQGDDEDGGRSTVLAADIEAPERSGVGRESTRAGAVAPRTARPVARPPAARPAGPAACPVCSTVFPASGRCGFCE
jgi:hypothetical protein